MVRGHEVLYAHGLVVVLPDQQGAEERLLALRPVKLPDRLQLVYDAVCGRQGYPTELLF